MKKILLMLLATVFITGCEEKITYKDIKSDEAYAIMQTKEVVILDVREEDEYKLGHIKDAINISVNELDNITKVVSDKNTTILVYCRTGIRAKKAAANLAILGYNDVYNFGGINSWPYELEEGSI